MKQYELTYIISPDLEEKELEDISEKINGFLREQGGILIKSFEFEKRKLGCPIRKKEEGLLTNLEFSLNPEKLKDFDKKIRSEERILRYMIVAKKPEKAFEKKKKARRTPFSKTREQKKVELKEIDKKIEEILNESR